MMYCQQCGNVTKEESRLCPKCGAEINKDVVYIEFKKANQKNAWVLVDDKVIVFKRINGGKKYYYISEMESLEHDLGTSRISFLYCGKVIKLKYLRDTDTKAKADDAFSYMQAFIQKSKTSNNSIEKRHVSFSSPTTLMSWAMTWVLEKDKVIIQRGVVSDKEYTIRKMERVWHNMNSMYPSIAFYYGDSIPIHLYYQRTDSNKAIEAFDYIQSVIRKGKEEEDERNRLIEEELLNKKVQKYKKIKTRVYNERMERLKMENEHYILFYLESLPKEGEFIVSCASLEDLRNSHDKLRRLSDLDKLMDYLCNNRIIYKEEDILGHAKYRLRESLEKETVFEDDSVAIAIWVALNKKAKEYCLGCNDDKNILERFKEYSAAFNVYYSSVLNMPLQSLKPMNPETAGTLGTAVGGLTFGTVASINANIKMEKYKKNQNYYYSKSGEKNSAKNKTELSFYKLQNALYEYEDVYEDWIATKGDIIKSKQ